MSVGFVKTIIDAIAASGKKNTEEEIREAIVSDGNRFVGANVGLIKTGTDTIKSLVDTDEVAGPYTYLNAGGEQVVYEDTATTRRRIWLDVSNCNMVQTGTFRIKRKVDGTNYDLWIEQAVTVGASDERVFDSEFTTNQPWEITYEEDADEGSNREIPFNVIIQVLE